MRTFEINRRLVQRGHDVTVVTMNYPGAQAAVRDGIIYKRAGFKTLPFCFLSYFAAVPMLLRKYNYDLVVEDNISPFTFGLSPLYTKKPVIAQMQCFFARYSSVKHRLPFWLIEKYGTRLYKNFIVLTNQMARQIRKLNPKARIAVISNGINRLAKAKYTHKNYLLFIGRIDFFQKGLDLLLQAAKILQRKNADLTIKIAGAGADKEKLLKTIAAERLNNVKYIGKVQGATKEKSLAECAMLLLPSRFEIFPFTILEAAAYAKPFLCFDIENLHELVKEGIGVAAPAYDIERFAELILELFNNREYSLKLGKTAYQWAGRHLWDGIAKQQEAFYFSCGSQCRIRE